MDKIIAIPFLPSQVTLEGRVNLFSPRVPWKAVFIGIVEKGFVLRKQGADLD